MDPITFLATFPDIQSAIKVAGAQDGARIQLDLPETELPAVARLLMLRGQVLRVTVEARLQNKTEQRGDIPERPKRKSGWTRAEEQGTD